MFGGGLPPMGFKPVGSTSSVGWLWTYRYDNVLAAEVNGIGLYEATQVG